MGTSELSGVILAELGATHYALQVYPNLATAAGTMQVTFTGQPQPEQSVRILDSQGRLVREYPLLQLGQQLVIPHFAGK